MIQNDRICCLNYCGHRNANYYKKENLKTHLNFECGVEQKFQCSTCQKKFKRKLTLNIILFLFINSFV